MRPTFSPDGSRTSPPRSASTSASTPWPRTPSLGASRFGCVWEPVYRPNGGGLVAPVRIDGAWTLAEDGKPIWSGRYVQLWNQRLSPDGQRIAAVVAPGFGRWTVAVDDRPWRRELQRPGAAAGLLARRPTGRGDRRGTRTAGRWRWTARRGRSASTWSGTRSSAPTASRVLAKVERDGRFAIAVDGKVWSPWFDGLWDPVFSPDGRHVLIRAVEDGEYFRQVVPLAAGARS